MEFSPILAFGVVFIIFVLYQICIVSPYKAKYAHLYTQEEDKPVKRRKSRQNSNNDINLEFEKSESKLNQENAWRDPLGEEQNKKKQNIELEVVVENGLVKSFDFIELHTGIEKSYKVHADISRAVVTSTTENLYRNRFIDYLENYEEIQKQERIKNFGLEKKDNITVLHRDSMLSKIGAKASKLNQPTGLELLVTPTT